MYQPFSYANPFYQQQQPQLPNYAAQLPQQGIMGRTIGSHEEIAANDVPMNGTPAYFPTQDGSVIFAKQWNQDGSITTLRYVPEATAQETQQQPTLFDIVNQLNDIQDLLTAKPATKRTTTKKAATDDTSE